MRVENKALLLDLVEWVAQYPRPFSEVMDAWRTSCPRLTIWEDALDLGLVARRHQDALGSTVEATPAGLAFLRSEWPAQQGARSTAAPNP